MNAFKDMAVAWKDVSETVKRSKTAGKSCADTPPTNGIDRHQLIERTSNEQEFSNPVTNGGVSSEETVITPAS